ncbi:hypothetical protein [Magnetospirillum sp. UT-4]|uniref:hypothetical protein n=1 Tax=Magnetospirillum sp. UT-4 TaxID=2681467 RepID=UPI001573C2BC|nr:hypothetical protein [Magnetospirillum sp. UT-4]
MSKTASLSHHHPVSHRPAPRHERPGRLVAWIAAGAVVAAAGLAAWLVLGNGEESADPGEALIGQMRAAASGAAPPSHAFGGSLAVSSGANGLMVTAQGLPTKACVQAGWRLAKDGTVIVNGTLPTRLSAARLADLCGQAEGGATLTWVPDGK